MQRIDAAIAIVCRAGQVLISRRRDDDTFPGLWEFPGGKQEDGETLEQCLARELMEELAITAKPRESLPAIEHDYPELLVRLHPFVCDHTAGDAKPLESSEVRWIDPGTLRDYEFPAGNQQLMEDVIRLLARPSGAAKS
jgi:mutator protein MutT